jgi:hypothetical protein
MVYAGQKGATLFQSKNPVIQGYTANPEYISIYGIFQDMEITVTYVPNQHVLTVHYVDAKGNQIAPDNSISLEYGKTYNIQSPEVTNYSTSTLWVSGTLYENREITVKYEKIACEVVIHFVYEDGVKAMADHRENVSSGSSFYLMIPSIFGYAPSVDFVSFSNITEDMEITVVFSPEEVVSVSP